VAEGDDSLVGATNVSVGSKVVDSWPGLVVTAKSVELSIGPGLLSGREETGENTEQAILKIVKTVPHTNNKLILPTLAIFTSIDEILSRISECNSIFIIWNFLARECWINMVNIVGKFDEFGNRKGYFDPVITFSSTVKYK
jgi:hypothetical protein